MYVLIYFQSDGSEKTKSVFDTLDCCRVTGKVRFTVRLGQFMWSYPMSIFRLTAVAVSLTLFSACGGGGGGGAAGGGGGGGGIALEPLPPFLVNRVNATASVRGETPESITSAGIEREFVSRAGAANRLIGDIFNLRDGQRIDLDADCTGGRDCEVNFTSGGRQHRNVFSLDNFGNIPEIEGVDLTRFNEEYEAVMTDGEVRLVQLRNAGRSSRDAILEFQSYGGWLENSVFAFQVETLEGSADEGTAVLLTSYSFGNESGTRPAAALQWSGVVVGTSTGEGMRHVIHGDAAVEYLISDPEILDNIVFRNVINLNNSQPVSLGPNNTDLRFQNVPLMPDGRFVLSNGDGDIEGVFYGGGHEEVGGIFHTNTYIGAFGAIR